MISSGAKKDLMVLQFCKALLDVSMQDETRKDVDLKNREINKNYHLNKRIDRAIKKLSDRIQNTITVMFKEGGVELSAWVKKNLEKRIGLTLLSLQENSINLEMLAVWVLFVNFCERHKSIHKAFEEYTESDQYFRIIELIGGTSVANIEGEMFEISYDIVMRIKA